MTLPIAPGSAQTPPTAQQMLSYLDQLGRWVADCRVAIDRIDQKVQAANPGQGTQDIAMTLTVWQAVSTRHNDLLKVWDSGRVTEIELKKLGALIWGNLNDMLTPGATISSGGGLALSLPEACRMLEALISQLTSRLQLANLPTEASTRIAALRAQLERIRTQSALDPPDVRQNTEAAIANLADDLTRMIAVADRGGDIGGVLGPLEVRAARLERDLIVGHAERAMLTDKIKQAKTRLAELVAREESVTELAARTRASLTPAPKYAVPRLAALGEVPATSAELDDYLSRLEQVAKALDMVQQANLQALARKDQLSDRLQRVTTADDPLANSLRAQIRGLLDQSPAQLTVIEPLITAYEATQVTSRSS